MNNAVGPWISVKERLPEDGVTVAVWVVNERWLSKVPSVGFLDGGHWVCDYERGAGDNVTHWAEIHAPEEKE